MALYTLSGRHYSTKVPVGYKSGCLRRAVPESGRSDVAIENKLSKKGAMVPESGMKGGMRRCQENGISECPKASGTLSDAA